jgi:quercetin dioxygenase-like cupin family protein
MQRGLRENAMQITRNTIETMAGPSEWFTGAVYVDTVATPADGSRLSASSVHFTPGARTAWHEHCNAQTLHVIEGIGLTQVRGGEVAVIQRGDTIWCSAARAAGAPTLTSAVRSSG